MSRGSPQPDHFEHHIYHQSMQYYHKLHQNSLDPIEITILYNFRCSLEPETVACNRLWWGKGESTFVKFVLFVFCFALATPYYYYWLSIVTAVFKFVNEFKCKLTGNDILSVFDMVMILNFIKLPFAKSRKLKITTMSNTDNISLPVKSH